MTRRTCCGVRIVAASIPVALYGILQKQQWDPLPWGGDTSIRIAGHMGNAIFIGAYLIMVIPLTLTRIIESFSNILQDEKLALADVTRSSIYIFTLAIQVLALFWTQSRGPWIGLGVGLFTFVLIALVSLRNATTEGGKGRAAILVWPAIFFFIGIIGLFTSGLVAQSATPATSLLLFVGFIGVLFLLILVFAAARIGWRWLWLGWISLALLVAFTLLMGNLLRDADESTREAPLIGTLVATFDTWSEVPGVGRLFTFLQDDRGTARVRVLIWEGALDLFQPHDPLSFPDGEDDAFNWLRPLIGYGPESMYVAYNSFYPPELGIVEARNASPDRAHNETFDALVITGALGFAIWQILYVSVFYFGFKWIGVVRSRFEAQLLIALWVLGALVASIAFVPTKGWEYIGVAIPFGSIAGLVFYLIYYALFARRGDADETHRLTYGNQLLLVGLLTALIAFYVEIHFGIAIAATRLLSFMFIGVLLVVGYVLPRESAETTQPLQTAQATRKRRRRGPAPSVPRGWLAPAVGYGALLAILIGTMMFGFMNFTPKPGELSNIQSVADLPTAGDIFFRALFVHPQRDFVTAPFLFGVVILSWLFTALLMVSEMIKSRELAFRGEALQRAALSSLLVIGTIGLVVGLLYGFVQAGLLRQSFVAPAGVETMSEVQRRIAEATRVGQYLTTYYVYVLSLLLLAALSFSWGRATRAKQWGTVPGWVALPALALVGLILMNVTNLRVIQADMVYKRGKPFDAQASQMPTPEQQIQAWDNAIGIYEAAIDMAPNEDFYYLWLGRALLEKSSLVSAEQRPQLLNVARDELLNAQDINPLNTDHTANLARLNVRWASAAQGDERIERIAEAERYYQDALNLSPQNSIIRNELALMYLGLEADCEKALDTLRESAEIDPFFVDTSVSLSDAYRRCAAGLDADEQQAYIDEAETWADLALTQPSGRNRTVESLQARVTQLYLQLANNSSQNGELDEALRLAEKALDIAPEAETQTIRDFIEQLESAES